MSRAGPCAAHYCTWEKGCPAYVCDCDKPREPLLALLAGTSSAGEPPWPRGATALPQLESSFLIQTLIKTLDMLPHRVCMSADAKGHGVRREGRVRGWSFLESLLTSKGRGHSEAPDRGCPGQDGRTRHSGAQGPYCCWAGASPRPLPCPALLPTAARGRPGAGVGCGRAPAPSRPRPFPGLAPRRQNRLRSRTRGRAHSRFEVAVVVPGWAQAGPQGAGGPTAPSGHAAPAPETGGPPAPPRPLYKKKRRQHLPLDTPGGRGRPGPGRQSSPV